MAADSPPRSMSLVPYMPTESREIVLRHGSSVVVYDQHSRQLSLRDASRSNSVELADCPFCHRPLREDSPSADHAADKYASSPSGDVAFVNPAYFRMLHHSTPSSAESSRPPSPRRRLAQPPPQPAVHVQDAERPVEPPSGAEFIGSAPAPETVSSHGISSSAFSPNYFKTFFVEEGELGRGGKGVVLLVRHVLDGVPLGQFACKRVPVGDDHEWLEKVLVEVQLLQDLSHQNLVSYRHVWLEDCQVTKFGPSVPCAFILQQYCNSGDLLKYVFGSSKAAMTNHELKERMRRRSKGEPEPPIDLNSGRRRMHFDEIFSFFKDITSGLHHLHVNGYIHRDLKPSNCLLHQTGQKMRVLVSDFGEVQVVNMSRQSTGATGTISYCAPEVLHRTSGGTFGNFTTKSDIFSLGMIVYFMCFGKLPYRNADAVNEENEDLDQLRAEIMDWGGFDDERRGRPDLPDNLYKFLRRLLSLDPSERPGTEEILQGIRGGYTMDGSGTGSREDIFEGLGPRISSADSPSVSRTRNQPRTPRGSTNYTRPGPSKLRHATAEVHRSPSPEKTKFTFDQDQEDHSDTPDIASSVVLRTRQLDTDSPSPRSPRLILPPPPPRVSRLRQLATNPAVITMARFLLFVLKMMWLFQPCAPFAPAPNVAYTLLCLATLDFAPSRWLMLLPDRWDGLELGVGTSILLLGVHLVTLRLALRWEVLCQSNVRDWQE